VNVDAVTERLEMNKASMGTKMKGEMSYKGTVWQELDSVDGI
jgi:hypothetical protein